MNKQELIERIEDFPCEASLVTEMIRINKNTLLGWVKELDLPQPIKLKDVIARIKIFDVGTQKVWLNEILDELGSDYGILKYKAGYEQGKLEGEWVGQQLKDADKIRQELNKPVVPQFVADWINSVKTNGLKFKNTYGFYERIEPSDDVYRVIYYIFKESIASKEIRFFVDENTDTFALAWINGYTVVKEKRYFVRLKHAGISNSLLKRTPGGEWWFGINFNDESQAHTRKELEEAGFGWVLDCPGVEVEEVTE